MEFFAPFEALQFIRETLNAFNVFYQGEMPLKKGVFFAVFLLILSRYRPLPFPDHLVTVLG